ncbi:hypothetical protein Tco_0585977 [Tanacetum coccineum]
MVASLTRVAKSLVIVRSRIQGCDQLHVKNDIHVVAVDRLWEHIPIVGLMTDMVKRDVEIETVGECVDEIDKLAELIGEMQLKQEDQGCVHASNGNFNCMSFMYVVAY